MKKGTPVMRIVPAVFKKRCRQGKKNPAGSVKDSTVDGDQNTFEGEKQKHNDDGGCDVPGHKICDAFYGNFFPIFPPKPQNSTITVILTTVKI